MTNEIHELNIDELNGLVGGAASTVNGVNSVTSPNSAQLQQVILHVRKAGGEHVEFLR